MSVPVYKRSENKLQALSDTIAAASYVIKMCENDKIFPKKTRWSMGSRIIDECISAVVHVRTANKIKIVDEDTFKKRTDLQRQVLLEFEHLWGIMDLAVSIYSIPMDKVGVFSSLLLKAEGCVYNWMRSDIRKYTGKS